MVEDVDIIEAGLIGYEDGWAWQRRLHAQRVAGEIDDTVLLLEHPPVYTAGRRTEAHERPSNGSRVIDVDRGGKITWHGPGQLVGYPIIELDDPIDVVAYVRRIEEMLIRVCADAGLDAVQIAGRSGVWMAGDSGRSDSAASGHGLPDRNASDRKLAAIGIRVANRVTLHGFALNCQPDLSWFDPIVPCGIADAGVSSLSAELGGEVTVAEIQPLVRARLPELTAAYARSISA
jgi:lipoyl(octanoyl) transferase